MSAKVIECDSKREFAKSYVFIMNQSFLPKLHKTKPDSWLCVCFWCLFWCGCVSTMFCVQVCATRVLAQEQRERESMVGWLKSMSISFM